MRQTIIAAILSILLVWMLSDTVSAGKYSERYYQDKWCLEHEGRTEVVLPDRTRCDCVTDTHAIEFDFAKKWAEAIGQSLHYSRMIGKRGGIVLISRKLSDKNKITRVRHLIEYFKLPIDLFIMEVR